MGMSTPTRLPRVVPAQGWSFNGYHLPEGTQVGCQSYTLHFNPDVFKDPHAFQPERWLESPSPEMHRDWFAFSLGARGCLARNLAQTELLLAVQAVVREGILEGATALGGEIEIFEWFSSALVKEKLELVWS
jgi:cytochrome P450